MKLLFNLNFLFCIFFFHHTALAQTITVNKQIDFGHFALADNNAERRIIFSLGNTYASDPQYIFFDEPEMGEVTLDDFPPNTQIDISIGITTLDHNAVPRFNLQNTFTDPETITTDNTGSALFRVGGTLLSDGDGSTPADGGYSGIFTVSITP